jgi:type I restriction enzyme M protein
MRTIEYRNPVDTLALKISEIFDLFTHRSRFKIIEDQAHIVLLLISLYKDGYVTAKTTDIQSLFDSDNNDGKASSSSQAIYIYRQAIQILNESLAKIDAPTFQYIWIKLLEIDRNLLTANFPEVFDNVLYRVSKSYGRHAGEFIQPAELSRFMVGLADLKKDAKVFNPFAGVASFGVHLNQDQSYVGQELNPNTWALGALRLLAHQRTANTRYVCNDSIIHWSDNIEKYDLVISSPPLEMRLGRQYAGVENNAFSLDHFLIRKSIDLLNEDGKIVVLLSHGFLQREHQEKNLREFLVKQDLIDSIISLPGGLLLNTGISLNILVLSKAKKLPGKVKFVDAKKFVIIKGHGEKVLDDVNLKISLNSDEEDENVIKIVDNEQIRNKDYNLSVARYFQKKIDGVKLGDVLELVGGQRGNLPEAGKLIRIRDLKDDKVDFTLDVSIIEEAELSRPHIKLVSESCLLIATRWSTLKPTLFEFKGEPIFIGHEILAFKVNEEIADKAYLINELHADYVKEQLEAYRFGASVMPIIRTSDLMEIVVILPSLEEQRRKINSVFQEVLFKEKDKIAFIRKVFNEELGVKQHNIRQHLKNVKDSLDTLMDFMEKMGGVLKKEDVINPNRNVTVGKRFDKMYSSLENVIEEINTLTNEQTFSKAEPIDLIQFISASVDAIIHPNFDVVLTKDEVGISETELDKLIISFSAKDFRELINNVVENAVRHGFTDRDKFYKVVFDISMDEETAILTIKNNGAPFPKYISSQIGVKGKKAGKNANQGIGAWKIVQSIEHFGHQYEIIDEPEKEFPAGWIFKFKLITE